MSRQRVNSKSPTVNKQIRKHSKDSDSSSSERRYGKFWKPNEDALLIELHSKFNGNWGLIAGEIPGRNLKKQLIQQKRFEVLYCNKDGSVQIQIRGQASDSVCSIIWSKLESYRRIYGRQIKQVDQREVFKQFGSRDQPLKVYSLGGQNNFRIVELFWKTLVSVYINFNIFKGFRLYRIYGPKWSEIAKMLDRRPENQVKNRFYSFIKRVHMLEEKSDDDDDDGNSSFSEQPNIPQPIPIYQPLETIQSIKEEHDNTKNDSIRNDSFMNIQNRTPSHRIQPSINLIQGLDSFDSKQFEGIHSQDISPFHQRRILMDYSPINFEYAHHHPNFDNVQEDVRELRSQIECISLEKIN